MEIDKNLAKERLEEFMKKGKLYFYFWKYFESFAFLFFGFELMIKVLNDYNRGSQNNYKDYFEWIFPSYQNSLNQKITSTLEVNEQDLKIRKINNDWSFWNDEIWIDSMISWLFQVRHNLFHWNKNMDRKKDEKLMKVWSFVILEIYEMYQKGKFSSSN